MLVRGQVTGEELETDLGALSLEKLRTVHRTVLQLLRHTLRH